ncbi:NADH-quinone oxidoreductase chain 3 [Poriferisphaera corsica]|uniref:NADH-quinone oxidoreductase chain 3 n=1 Tax=Poriferisphaera corsica TaxID=2528020 RepID=A0A517YV58_9BACT|nr:molybdopterin-dependent oxidoreductase [Poriferisphaera corsica]QDU34121.1 NADH-quinone oxidoreductase chain 3 [Poriferisphaera corsica]
MPKLKIDGQECEFEGKKTVLQVAVENGIEIPHYCYHPSMSIVASCRICLAEVAQPNPRNDNKVELIPKLVPTCQTPAADGMEVYVKSPKSVANQKAVMEYLLINHPLDCPVCDQAGECSLQDYSYKYGRSCSRFEETKIKQPKKDIGTNVLLYSDRCIMCTRCVRFTREVSGTSELGVFGRGSSEQIDVFPGKPLENELSGNVVDICPVGALLDKDFLMSMRVWNLERASSIDGITASGDNISIEYNQDKVYRVKPRTNIDVNKWWISDEIRYGWKFVQREDRLRMPSVLNAEGGREDVEWKPAVEAVAARLKKIAEESGEGAISLLVSPMLSCEDAYLLGKLAVSLDPKAKLGVGQVPMEGEDKSFPGGYTIYAEKAPNARGVRRVLSKLTDNVLDYDSFVSQAAETKAVIVTGNYADAWVEDKLADMIAGKYVVLVDTLPSKLSETADVVLPGATWVEKAGTFENINNRLQRFVQAIKPLDYVKSEGQIAMDLMRYAGADFELSIYDDAAVRAAIGGEFVTDVHVPSEVEEEGIDLEYVEL